ncbi:MAG TPA: isoprenylcysteine carboxylmethyltransferase family protein [Verrucomicrobiae bacterium]|nr:isoprenylcysteine carboxylmethyltransferase family protein [Verrucomicrobiae bacterium]
MPPMPLLRHWLIPALWGVWGAYWWLASRKTTQTRSAEAPATRLVHLMLIYAAFGLMLAPGLRNSPLGGRWLPDTAAVFWIGAGIVTAGLGFAAWARVHLGQYWSGTITLKAGHRLIRTGPYALARHPIYTGFVTGIAGTAVALGEWRGLLGAAFVITAYLRKIRIEERWLTTEFGEEYARYQREVKALVPFLL